MIPPFWKKKEISFKSLIFSENIHSKLYKIVIIGNIEKNNIFNLRTFLKSLQASWGAVSEVIATLSRKKGRRRGKNWPAFSIIVHRRAVS